jgi:hypothetical protein
MEFGKAFSFQFQDPDWIKKILIGALIMLIPLVGELVVIGWGFEITKRVIRQDPSPLPDWSNFMGNLVSGLKLFVVYLVYLLPIILVSACSQSVYLIPSDVMDSNTMATVSMVVMICFGCVAFLYGIVIAFLLPAAVGNFAATDQLGAAFRFGEVFNLVKAAPVAYLLVILGSLLSSIIASLGSIACGIGALATTAYAMTVNGHLQGQAYNEAKAKQGL